MDNDYEFLTEKESMWAEMLIEVLKNNNIACTSFPVYGAGMTLKTSLKERLRIYVPNKDIAKAKELLEELFSENKA